MTRQAGLFEPTRPPVEPETLPAALAEAAAELPESVGRDFESVRRQVLMAGGELAQQCAVLECAGLAPAWVVETWAWVGWLRIVRGYAAHTTVTRYLEVWGRFLGWAKAQGLDYRAAELADLERWQRWLMIERRCGNGWRAQQLVTIRSFYDWRARRLNADNPAAELRGPKPDRRVPRKYTTAQLRQMLAQVAGGKAQAIRDRAILLLLITTGARRDEVAQLNLEDVELGQRTGVVRIRGKGRKEREVPIEGPVVDALRAWAAERDNLQAPVKDPLAMFLVLHRSRPGGRLHVDGIERIVARVAKRSGLRDWGVHRFRATFATALYDDGIDIETIRALLGHESIETTRGYLAVSERMRKTRLSASRQHQLLGTRSADKPLWTQIYSGGFARE